MVFKKLRKKDSGIKFPPSPFNSSSRVKELHQAYAEQIKRKEAEIEKLKQDNAMLMKTSMSLSEKLNSAKSKIKELKNKLKKYEDV